MTNFFKEPLSQTIWEMKYRYLPHDQTMMDSWMRVAKAVALAEKNTDRAHWQSEFYNILNNFNFLPGGRILAGAGTGYQVTLFNCFVMNIAEDSLTGIFDALKEGAKTLQQGGGVGYDFSILRPRGDLIKKTGLPASGPVSFMHIWDATCATLLSSGARRGAMMGVLRCDHPDILEFITAKEDKNALRHFNVSVMVSDDFMQAVKQDEVWPLVFPLDSKEAGDYEVIYRLNADKQKVPYRVYHRLKARELWQKIIYFAYQHAEPGVLFGDTINRLNNLWYCEHIIATNPCGEIPLPAYGACNLGAINLTQFIDSPWTSQAKIKWAALEKTVQVATRFQDNVIDISNYPLEIQKKQALATRRIGVGITGLADAFVLLGIKYGSKESVTLARDIMKRIADVTWQTSIELAKEKGSFSLFHEDYLRGSFVQTLDPSIQQAILKYGMRNSHHNTIAPTGTISLLANNISNGIEPIFKAEYTRHIRAKDGDTVTCRVKDFAFHEWQQQHLEKLPPAWIDTDMLLPEDHLKVQAAMQPFIDNAISKTINIPRDFPFDSLVDIYTKAYTLGLKGCTIFRPNPVTGSVLEITQEEDTEVDHCCKHD